jgi:steroid delta-isomerase-like uncharacterized protein
MTREQIVALFARRDQAWNSRDWAALASDYLEDATAESPMQGTLVGRERIGEVYANWMTGFPDLVVKTEDLIIDGNRVAQIVTITGTHTGPFGGVPAIGRKFHVTGALLFTLSDDGRIIHNRRVYDVTKMLVQLGALRMKPADVIPSRPSVLPR